MPSSARLFALVLSLSLPFTSLAAQQAAPAPPEPTGPIHLSVVVSDRGGKPLPGLTQQDFKVLDNKVPQALTSFEALGGEQAPVEIVLVIDAVNTTFSLVASERDQIDHFLRAHEHLAHPITLAVLTDTGLRIQQGGSDNGKQVSEDLDQTEIGLRSIHRSSGFWGADERLRISLKALDQLGALEGPKPGRKLVIWVSPGWPLLSGPAVQLDAKQEQQVFSTIVQISTGLRKARVTLYALDALGARESVLHSSYYQSFLKGITKPREAVLGDLALQVVAAQTGGLVLNSNDLTEQLERVAGDATAYYDITYNPPPAEQRDEYHRIDVQIGKPGLAARTLAGYYSQP
jgi:VWFA-related protein